MSWKTQAESLWQRIHSGSKIRLNFWLDTSQQEEAIIASMVYYLKYGGEGSPGRIFAKTIRDGIRLIWSLRRGETQVLTELFPWIEDQLSASKHPSSSNPKLASQLERIEQLLLEQQHMPIAELEQDGLKRLDVGSFTPPDFDDDDLPAVNVRKASSSGSNANQNFLNSLSALQ